MSFKRLRRPRNPLFLAKMVVEFLWERKRTSHIKWSTLETEAGTLIFLVLAFGGGMRPSDLFSATAVDTVIYERHVALVIRGGETVQGNTSEWCGAQPL